MIFHFFRGAGAWITSWKCWFLHWLVIAPSYTVEYHPFSIHDKKLFHREARWNFVTSSTFNAIFCCFSALHQYIPPYFDMLCWQSDHVSYLQSTFLYIYIHYIYIHIIYILYFIISNHIYNIKVVLWGMISLDDPIWARKAPGAFLRALTELSALAEHKGTVRVRLVDNGFFANWLQVPQKNVGFGGQK